MAHAEISEWLSNNNLRALAPLAFASIAIHRGNLTIYSTPVMCSSLNYKFHSVLCVSIIVPHSSAPHSTLFLISAPCFPSTLRSGCPKHRTHYLPSLHASSPTCPPPSPPPTK